jgi:2-keto-4-pentenoate hydratase/2-oxohepta-3-ene-1,7-dioic acid hydratase in catechol pathway
VRRAGRADLRLVNFGLQGGSPHLGLMVGDRIIDARGAAVRKSFGNASVDGLPLTVDDFLAESDASHSALRSVAAAARELAVSRDGVYGLDEVTFYPPVLKPGKILAAGRNFREHVKESHTIRPGQGADTSDPGVPTGFVKVSSALTGHRHPIRIPGWIKDVDYESELVAVVGRRADGITEGESLSYLAGYTVGNDVSAREIQFAERAAGGGPSVGKNPRTFAPIGPCLVTMDEIEDPLCLRVWCRVNGELRQDALTTDMIHDITKLVAWYSKIGLDPGDLIMSGTPAGVGSASKRYLKGGDVVECGVDGVGILLNPVVDA